MNEKFNNWKKELKQKLKYKIWTLKTWLHEQIDKIHRWCRIQLIGLLDKIATWSHNKLDEIWDKLYEEVDEVNYIENN